MGAVVGNVYYNTEPGLSPALDRLTTMLDRDSQSQQQLAGLTPALTSSGIPVPRQRSIFGGVLDALGIGAPPTDPTPSTPMPLASAAPHAVGATSSVLPSYRGPAAGFDNNVDRTLGFEGKLNARDTNGTPSMYGINQAAHPDIDVTKLTPDQAKGIYRTGYWDAIGADNLSPQLQRAAFDTAVIAGPAKAKELLAASGGDATKYMSLREDFQRGLLQSDPQKYGRYGEAWKNRNYGLRMDIAALQSRAGSDPAMAYSPTTDSDATRFQTASATGGTPMPIASSGSSVQPALQQGSTGPLSAAAKAPLGGVTNEALGAMISNPASRQIGLQLWQQKLTGKDFGFSTTPDGTVIRTDARTGTAVPVYQAPVKREHVELNGRVLSFDPQSGTYADATPAGMPQGYRPASADERKLYGVGPTTPFFFGPDNKPATLQGGTQVTVNNAVNPILKGLGDQFVEGAQGARDAADTIRSVQNARTQFQGGIIAGFGADESLALRKLGTALGLNLGDPSKVVNTEAFRTQIKPIVLTTVKGLGAGSGISNADREFAEAAVGGSIKLEPATIARVLDITERAARAKIDRHNALAGQMLKTQPDLAAAGPMLQVQMPPAATGGGMPTLSDPSQVTRLPSGTHFRTPDGRIKVAP